MFPLSLSLSLIFSFLDAYVWTQVSLLTKEKLLEIKKVASMIRLSHSGTLLGSKPVALHHDQTYSLLCTRSSCHPVPWGRVEFPGEESPKGFILMAHLRWDWKATPPHHNPGSALQSWSLLCCVSHMWWTQPKPSQFCHLKVSGIRVSWASSDLHWSPVG